MNGELLTKFEASYNFCCVLFYRNVINERCVLCVCVCVRLLQTMDVRSACEFGKIFHLILFL